MNILEFIDQHKIIAIARKIAPMSMLKTAKALLEGGVRLVEITFDQSSDHCIEDTVASIGMLKQSLGNNLAVGAGTVVTVDQVKAAAEAGADFILAPNTDVEIIRLGKELGMVVIPGASTPTEILSAWKTGADIVKLFPAANLGIPYIKAIRAPISQVPLMAVGGIDETNVKAFLDNGCMSCGIGSNIVRHDLIKAGKFDELVAVARTFVRAANGEGSHV